MAEEYDNSTIPGKNLDWCERNGKDEGPSSPSTPGHPVPPGHPTVPGHPVSPDQSATIGQPADLGPPVPPGQPTLPGQSSPVLNKPTLIASSLTPHSPWLSAFPCTVCQPASYLSLTPTNQQSNPLGPVSSHRSDIQRRSALRNPRGRMIRRRTPLPSSPSSPERSPSPPPPPVPPRQQSAFLPISPIRIPPTLKQSCSGRKTTPSRPSVPLISPYSPLHPDLSLQPSICQLIPLQPFSSPSPSPEGSPSPKPPLIHPRHPIGLLRPSPILQPLPQRKSHSAQKSPPQSKSVPHQQTGPSYRPDKTDELPRLPKPTPQQPDLRPEPAPWQSPATAQNPASLPKPSWPRQPAPLLLPAPPGQPEPIFSRTPQVG